MSTHLAKDYVPTIIDSRSLLPRLGAELSLLEEECKLAWPGFKQHPAQQTVRFIEVSLKRFVGLLLAPNVLAALLTVVCIVVIVLLAERTFPNPKDTSDQISSQAGLDMTFINLHSLDQKTDDGSIGRGGNARVGFRKGAGEGSGEVRRLSQGGGGGGNHEALPPQTGKLPPPSTILAPIPKAPPLNPPSLPVAGMDIDPALWKDLKAPVFGDPRSASSASSKGTGEGGGIGTNNGPGIGEGDGAGFGPGNKGNTGGGNKQVGCCGQSGGDGNSSYSDLGILRGKDVEQRARLLSKPEPQ